MVLVNKDVIDFLKRNDKLNIYIYGTEKFKNNIKSILTKAKLEINIETINSLFAIKIKLENSPQDIFIIDETKIIAPNFFTNKLKFLFPSDALERDFIEKYGVGDVCFNSINGMIGYINSRMKLEKKEKKNEISEAKTRESIDSFDTSQFKNIYEDDDYEYKNNDKTTDELIDEIEEEPEVRDLTLLKNINEIKEDEIENEMFAHLK